MSDKLREAATATISVVVPVLNEVALIPELSARLAAALEGLGRDFEVVFVDDGSTDGTADALAVAHREDTRFRSIQLSRNFGHQAASRFLVVIIIRTHFRSGWRGEASRRAEPTVERTILAMWQRRTRFP